MEIMGFSRAKRLGDVFTQLVRISLSNDVVDSLGDADVTFSQFETLRYIQRHPLSTVGDLAQGLHISYPSATNMVSRLHSKGLILKRGLRSDRRIVRLALSDEGTRLAESIVRERTARVGKILDGMHPNDCEHFLSGLEEFIVSAVRNGFGDADALCLNCGPDKSELCPLLRADTTHKCR